MCITISDRVRAEQVRSDQGDTAVMAVVKFPGVLGSSLYHCNKTPCVRPDPYERLHSKNTLLYDDVSYTPWERLHLIQDHALSLM